MFTPATREQAKARIALEGPSGSGKTYTALTLGTTMADRVALIDTERGSASKYATGKAGRGFAFDTLQMHKYDPRDLVAALAAAGQAGYGCIIVDSLSHFWMGSGGMLELVDAIGKRSGAGGGFGGWKEARPYERAMIDALLAYPGHVIVTMRTKTEWLIDDSGPKKKISKIGTKVEQREGIEYEFDIVGDLDPENTLVVSKSRCPELTGAVINRPGQDMANTVMEWLADGTTVPDAGELVDEAMDSSLTVDGARALFAKAQRYRLTGAAIMHPSTSQPTTLGALITERGQALRTANAQSTRQDSAPPAPQLRAVQAETTAPQEPAPAPEEVQPHPSAQAIVDQAAAATDKARIKQLWAIAAAGRVLDAPVRIGSSDGVTPLRAYLTHRGTELPDAPAAGNSEESEHAAAVAEYRDIAARAQLDDPDRDAHSHLGMPLDQASAKAIRELTDLIRPAAA